MRYRQLLQFIDNRVETRKSLGFVPAQGDFKLRNLHQQGMQISP